MTLEALIDNAYQTGRRAFPTIDLPLESFARFALARAEQAANWGETPECAADLYLAAACVEQMPAAVAEFLSLFGERMPKYLGRLARNADMVNEVRQIIATRCLVSGPDRPSALTSYSGAGSLEGWVRATAVREALALNKSSDRHVSPADSVLEAQVPWVDQEISLFRKIYREPVSKAFASACRQLPAEHRALLRLHFAQGVTTAQLATMYNLSRATVVRRLTDAREALVALVKSELKSTLGVTEEDFLSVVKLVNSQLDLRLSMVLRDASRAL